jgi:hypothetical protein
MTLREVFEACFRYASAHRAEGHAAWPLLEIALSSGARFTGFPAAMEGDRWVLDLAPEISHQAPSARVWIESPQVSAIVVHNYTHWADRLFGKGAEPAPESALALKRRAAELAPSLRVELQWRDGTATAGEIATAWNYLQAVIAALALLSRDAFAKTEIESKVKTVRLVSSHAGRFAFDGGTLGAEFLSGDAPPAAKELSALLSAIL